MFLNHPFTTLNMCNSLFNKKLLFNIFSNIKKVNK